MALLMTYGWPGNVRELENAIQRMMVVSKNKILDIQGLPPEIRGKEEGPKEKAKDLKGIARESSGIAEKMAILYQFAFNRIPRRRGGMKEAEAKKFLNLNLDLNLLFSR